MFATAGHRTLDFSMLLSIGLKQCERARLPMVCSAIMVPYLALEESIDQPTAPDRLGGLIVGADVRAGRNYRSDYRLMPHCNCYVREGRVDLMLEERWMERSSVTIEIPIKQKSSSAGWSWSNQVGTTTETREVVTDHEGGVVTVSQRALLETLRQKVDAVDERYDGYQSDLLDHLSDIVLLERENQAAATNIQQKVTAKTQALGVLIRSHAQPVGED